GCRRVANKGADIPQATPLEIGQTKCWLRIRLIASLAAAPGPARLPGEAVEGGHFDAGLGFLARSFPDDNSRASVTVHVADHEGRGRGGVGVQMMNPARFTAGERQDSELKRGRRGSGLTRKEHDDLEVAIAVEVGKLVDQALQPGPLVVG